MSEDKKKTHLKLVKNDDTQTDNTNKTDNIADEEFDGYDYEDYLLDQEDYYYNLIRPKNNYWGIINPDGGFVVEPIYDKIEPWTPGTVVDIDTFNEPKELPLRFILHKDGKFGIASDKKVLAEPVYDWIENYEYTVDGTRAGYFPAIKDKHSYYLDYDGNVIADFDYEQPFAPVFSNLTFGYTKGGNFSVVNLKTKKVIYENTYINVNSAEADINPHRLMLKLNKENKYIVLDEDGKIVSGLADNEGLKEYNITYLSDKVFMYTKEFEGLGSASGLVDSDGNILTDLKYRTITALFRLHEDNTCEPSDYLLCSPLVPQNMNIPGLPKLMGSMYKDVINYKGEVIKSNLKDAMDMPTPFTYKNAGCLPVYYYENGEQKELDL